MDIRDFIRDALTRTYWENNHFPFCKMDGDGTIEGTVDIKRNSSGIMNIAIIINYDGNVCNWENKGKTIKKFRTIDEAKLFVKEFNEALNSIPVIRFAEKFFEVDFSNIYTEYEEILV